MRKKKNHLRKNLKSLAIIIVFVLLAITLLFFQGQLTGQAVQDSSKRPLLKCGDTITQKTPSPIVLTAEDPLTQAPCKNGKGLVIAGSNKVLDCRGLNIAGATRRFTGIEVKGASTEVRNCRITGFETGMSLYYTRKASIHDNIFEQLSWGIALSGKPKENRIASNFFSTEKGDILLQTKGKDNKLVLVGNDFFGVKSIELESQEMPRLCEMNIGNYLAPKTREPLFLQAKSSCGISKEPLTKEGKKRSKQDTT